MGEIDHECTASAQRGRGRCVIYSVAIESWQLPCQNVFLVVDTWIECALAIYRRRRHHDAEIDGRELIVIDLRG